MHHRIRYFLVLAVTSGVFAEKLTWEQRVEIIRGLSAEFATAKVGLPRSKKALEYRQNGSFDKAKWEEETKSVGPAARVGDLLQITKVEIDDDRLILEINGGAKSKRKWYENVQVGMGTSTRPISQGPNAVAPAGTTLALIFDGKTPALPAAEYKKMLAPILDFERRTATEQLIDTLPPEVRQAVQEKRAIEGMDRDQVLLAIGRPRTKVREEKEGLETEDWIYGLPPGKVTFVTFANGKVIRVKETYAGLGGQTVPTMKPPI